MPTNQEIIDMARAGNIGACQRLRENNEMFRHAEISRKMLDAQVIILDEGRYYILEQLTDDVWSPVRIDLDVVQANRFLADTLYDHKPRRVLVIGESEKITTYECRFEETQNV